jgi:hypothetical protein
LDFGLPQDEFPADLQKGGVHGDRALVGVEIVVGHAAQLAGSSSATLSDFRAAVTAPPVAT